MKGKETEKKQTSWLSKNTFDKTNEEIKKWPEWKNEAYNRFYAMKNFSIHKTV